MNMELESMRHSTAEDHAETMAIRNFFERHAQ
jgi:hypothetical protein